MLLLFFGLQPLLHQRAMLWWVMVSPWCALSLGRELLKCWPTWLRWSASVPSFRKTLLAGAALLLAGLWLAPVRWLTGSVSAPLERLPVAGHTLAAGRCSRASLPTRFGVSEAPGRPPRELSAGAPRNGLRQRDAGRLPGLERPRAGSCAHLQPRSPVRAGTVAACLHVKFGRPGWAELLDQEGVNLVLVEAELHPFLRPSWSSERAGLWSSTRPATRETVALPLALAVRTNRARAAAWALRDKSSGCIGFSEFSFKKVCVPVRKEESGSIRCRS